ncbi:MAG: hypothetical protein GY866_38870, partial [Proteobacteria bacterium]|nr:hypothetical protein [Pseudomonadota bacterium]
MERPQTVDRYYKRNVFGITGAEVFWGLGLPVVLESTFLQLFLKTLGAPNVAIGLIPSFFSIGVSLFALFGDYTTAHLKYKRGAVVVFHLISAFSLLLFGMVLFFLGNGSFILLVFFTCYAVFCICIGMTVPVWPNYLVKIFSEERTVAALGIMMIGQNATKLVSAFLIVKVIE